MKGTIVTGSLIVFSDGFVWKRLSNEKAYKIWVSAENEDFELYKVRVDDESESLIESLEDLGKDIFVKEWSTTGYSQWDYVKGIAFCTKEKYTKMVSNNTSDWKTQIDKLIDDEVKFIGMWMWGDVKGYVLEKKVKFVKKYKDESREDEEGEEWEEVDSCWDYYMETDELIEEIMKKHNLKE